ncbi:MAG: 50S ribosomal protein L30 [Bacteroidales bacterium]|nr:50S ribosomal protein L30 [Bacteroidales bacterium]
MKKLKITQIRSRIGRPANQKGTLDALGIRKMHQSREIEVNDVSMGMIRKVQHLLKIEEVN